MEQVTKIENIKKKAEERIITINNDVEFKDIKAEFLGKKGMLSEIMKTMKDLSIESKKELGMLTNEAKKYIENLLDNRKEYLEKKYIDEKIKKEAIDVTLPGISFENGYQNPLELIIRKLENIFLGLGYSIEEGPEVENDEYNFEKLNLPKDHPARDMQDTFYIDPNTLLRTHTSPVQIRTMLQKENEPLRIICPGKVYRRDNDDATHSHQFMQLEGLVLGKNITFANLKGTLLHIVKEMFGENREIRLRPSYFPFTEPSVEVDVTCANCNGNGCSICKGTGYIEILGAGMVNKNVLNMSGYNDEEIQGFAFGIGIERIAMLKYGIEDIRNFYLNDLRFISQFKEEK